LSAQWFEAGVTLSWFSPSWQQRTTQLLCCSSPQWSGEEHWKKKAKLVVWNKDSLTEQQRQTTVTTIILIKKIYKARVYIVQFSHCLMPSALLSTDYPNLASSLA